MKKTTVLGNENKDENCESNQDDGRPEILAKVKELLDDKDAIQTIMANFNKEEES